MDPYILLALTLVVAFAAAASLGVATIRFRRRGMHPSGGNAPGWRVRCTSCGRTKDASVAGVVRLGGWGTKYSLGRCSGCVGWRWIAIERDPQAK